LTSYRHEFGVLLFWDTVYIITARLLVSVTAIYHVRHSHAAVIYRNAYPLQEII